MAVVLAYLIVSVTVGLAHSMADEDEEPSLLIGLLFPIIAADVAAWLAVEAWDAVRDLARDLI